MATLHLPELPTVEVIFSTPDARFGGHKLVGTWTVGHIAIPHKGDEVWLNPNRGDEVLYRITGRRWYHAESIELYVELVLDSDGD